MLTPTHIAFDLGIYFLLKETGLVDPNNMDILFLLSAQFIDLDHLFSKPIYHPKRNWFQTHFLHKNWLSVCIVSIALILLYRPLLFLWIGLLSHIFLDFVYIRMHKIDIK
ncbi:MAG: hypothetical protein ACD_78C00417G0007 [uncultured bacterium (gcode 4)]|uniref:Membrane-bound metal-dependent hydrolase n=1 Tax=uncultured bacterium (gcode 4) TaxID=1234023 RepID=K1YVW7_9BACT|nr:MAG: hypothetical protein ACD_78C00417G0007 [uncultured bacterium (gcode 4)]